MTDPTVLAIDTCEGTCSAALVRGNEVLATRSEQIGRGHAERLLPMIAEIMAQAEIDFGGISRLAVCTGPGTFTGLRIGLSVARGLAVAKDIPCVGLMSLPVMAAQAGGAKEDIIHTVVMGRGGQGFYQSFQGADSNGLPCASSEAGCMDGDIIQGLVDACPGGVVGSGASLVGAETTVMAVDPVMLARLAANLDPQHFLPDPAYLREADAKKGKLLLPVER